MLQDISCAVRITWLRRFYTTGYLLVGNSDVCSRLNTAFNQTSLPKCQCLGIAKEKTHHWNSLRVEPGKRFYMDNTRPACRYFHFLGQAKVIVIHTYGSSDDHLLSFPWTNSGAGSEGTGDSFSLPDIWKCLSINRCRQRLQLLC